MGTLVTTSDGIKVRFLNSGVGTLIGSSIDLFGADIEKFVIGDASGFEPEEDEDYVRGSVTYTGERGTIKVKYDREQGSLKISMVIPEDLDNISIGNIMVYSLYEQDAVPVILISLPRTVVKQNVSTDITNLGFKYPGTRMIISLSVTYVDATDAGIDVTIQPVVPTYSNLPFFGLDSDVPAGVINPWQQFILNGYSQFSGNPTLVTKDEDNLYYGTPLFQDLANPKYGIISGNDESGRVTWIWGQTYLTANELFVGNIGGLGYGYSGEQAVIIGGSSY